MQLSMGQETGMRIRAARKAKGLIIRQLAGLVGVSASAVSQWEAGTTNPNIDNIRKLTEILDVEFWDIIRDLAIDLPDKGQPPNREPVIVNRRETGTNVVQAATAPDFAKIEGLARDIPVLGTAVGGDDGDFRLNGTETDRAIRPPGLANARNIFALYTVNDSMYPAWRDGALFYVNPNRIPVIGDDVVVEILSEEAGEPGAAFLKRLKSRRDDKIVVEQFNPPKELEFARDAVRLYRVIPWEEALGLV